jgi:hypothetical protein
MELITLRRIMDRLLQNPNMRNLEISSAAAYVKDFCGINDIAPILTKKFTYLNIEDYKAELPASVLEVEAVYLCKFTADDVEYDSDAVSPHPAIYRDGTLNAALSESIINEKDKTVFGEYKVENNVLFTDIEKGVVEIYAKHLRVDDTGFPVLVYDGSLMQAVENYVKYRYYTILYESGTIPEKFIARAEREYTWYIAQYTSKVEIPNYDEAVAIAHSWQRLIVTRNRNTRGAGYPQFFTTSRNRKL